jgi:hypothetical protein
MRRPGVAVVQHGRQRVIEDLFTAYFEGSAAESTGDRRLFAPGVKTELAGGPNQLHIAPAS